MRALFVACAVIIAGCRGGCGKTPVPFKRGASDSQDVAADAPASEGVQFDDATRKVTLAKHEVERDSGSFRAALDWDLNADGADDAIAIATDADNHASFEAWLKPEEDEAPEKRTTIVLSKIDPSCILDSAALSRMTDELVLAKLDVSCAGEVPVPPPAAPPTAAPATAPAGEAPTVAPAEVPAAPAEAPPAPEPPPEPGVRTHTIRQYVVNANASPRVLLELAALPPADASDITPLALTITSQDQDADGHSDVLVTADIGSDDQKTSVPLVWLNRPSGLARERTEPERSLAALIKEPYQRAARDPVASLPAALGVLAAHRLLCHESGKARIWVDESAGLACGSSSAAGRAAVVQALALAKQEQLLAALEARAQMSSSSYRVEAADRERVNTALGTIRGQTNYTWERGPDLTPATGPNIRQPALGFASEDQLLLRGTTPTEFDLRTRAQAPNALAQNIVMTSPSGTVTVVDMVRDCTGRYLRLVPASSIVSGFVTGARGEDIALVSERPVPAGCVGGVKRPDRSGWTVLGWTATGVLLAQNSDVQLVPIDAEGKSAGPARMLSATEPAPALISAGALSRDGLRHALVTSEGVAIIERGAKPNTTLVRSPASCTGRVSEVAISPSGARVAMLCAGHVYWAHETPSPAVAATPSAPPAPR